MQQPQRPLVIVHANCMDGTGAAYAASFFLTNADYHAAAYGTEPPDVRGRDVYILDFAYPRDVLLDMAAAARSIVVIDHHATAEAALGDLDFAHFDMSKSGCVLTWEYFVDKYPSHLHPGMSMPSVLAFIQDRDLWQWRLSESAAINEYIRHPDRVDLTAPLETQIRRLANITEYWNSNYEAYVSMGHGLLREKRRLVDAVTAKPFHIAFSIDGVPYRIPTVWSPLSVTSEVGQALAKASPHGVGAVFGQYSHGRFGVSFRGVSGTDLARLLAEAYGGGGHDCAAGCGVTPDVMATLISTSN